MEKNKFSRFLTLIILPLIFLGCGTPSVRFNAKYLPPAMTRQPNRQVAFDTSQDEIIGRYLNSLNTRHDAGLFWFGRDRVYLNLEGDEIFSIDLSAQTVKAVMGEDKEEIITNLSKKVDILNTLTQKSALSQIIGSYFSLTGQQYTGKISFDDQRYLKVDIKTNEARNDTGMEAETCTSAKLIGDLMLDQNKKIAIEWDYPCKWLPRSVADIKVPQMLRKVQLSPTGKYIFYKDTVYNIERKGVGEKIILDYPNMISTAINPDWTKLAVLAGKGEQYRVVIYNLKMK